jgi:Zn-dependent protease with chaperone function
VRPTTAQQSSWRRQRDVLGAALLWSVIFLLAVFPAPLMPIAWLYHALCVPIPALAVLGRLMPPLSLSLGVVLVVVIVGASLITGVRELLATHKVAHVIAHLSTPLPQRLGNVARALAIEERLTYLPTPAPAALCYGVVSPRIAITAGLLHRLDDEELRAVLLHERHHLTRHDPLRYLALRALSAGLFMVPLTSTLRRWAETRMELAADRAALAVVPRGALAGALVAALSAPTLLPAGLASLSATEARIAHLAGRSERLPIPYLATLVTLALLAGLGLALAWLARPEQVWELLCALCPWLS